jgi:hypothetical protein
MKYLLNMVKYNIGEMFFKHGECIKETEENRRSPKETEENITKN